MEEINLQKGEKKRLKCADLTIRKQGKMEEIQNNNQTPPDSGSSSNRPTEEHQMKQVKEFRIADSK